MNEVQNEIISRCPRNILCTCLREKCPGMWIVNVFHKDLTQEKVFVAEWKCGTVKFFAV
jgi:hypothetical protein